MPSFDRETCQRWAEQRHLERIAAAFQRGPLSSSDRARLEQQLTEAEADIHRMQSELKEARAWRRRIMRRLK